MKPRLIPGGESGKKKSGCPAEVSLSPEVIALLDHMAEELAAEYLRLLKPLKAGPLGEESGFGSKE